MKLPERERGKEREQREGKKIFQLLKAELKIKVFHSFRQKFTVRKEKKNGERGVGKEEKQGERERKRNRK